MIARYTLSALAACTLAGLPAHALGTVTLDAIDAGFYRGAGSQDPDNTNYNTGDLDRFRSYFVFDLSAITDDVVSVSLKLFNPDTPGDGITGTPGDFSVYDVTTDITTLRTTESDGQAIHSDLGSGPVYGTIDSTTYANGVTLTANFNSAGIAAVNSAKGGLVAFGGRVEGEGLLPDNTLFRFTGNSFEGSGRSLADVQLVIETQPAGVGDSDGDGIDDTWEIANFGDLSTANATSDFDGDDNGDLIESRLNTDPKDPNSRLRARFDGADRLLFEPTSGASVEFKAVFSLDLAAPLNTWSPLGTPPANGGFDIPALDAAPLNAGNGPVYFQVIANTLP